jgi:hypothetical protein
MHTLSMSTVSRALPVRVNTLVSITLYTAFVTNWTSTAYSLQDVPLDTASQFDWHSPSPAMSQPAYGPAVLPVNPGPEASQLQDNQVFVETGQSQGYIIEHGLQGEAIRPFINQGRPLQSVRGGEVSQPTVTL